MPNENPSEKFLVPSLTAQDLRNKVLALRIEDTKRTEKFRTIMPDRLLDHVLKSAEHMAEKGCEYDRFSLDYDFIMLMIEDWPDVVSSLGGSEWFKQLCIQDRHHLIAVLKDSLEGRGFTCEIALMEENIIKLYW